MLLVFKLLLTPLLICLVSLVGRRWGPTVSGWLVGLPLTSGPVALFLALEQGTAFASHSAQGTLLGLISVAGFCLAYSWFSLRLSWLWSILASWGVFFVLTAVLGLVSTPLLFAFAGVIISLAVVLLLLPRSQGSSIITVPPSWETPLRMLVATTFVVVLTAVAGLLGPQLSGLLTPFPLYATILAIFTHHFQGSSAARQVLRGTVSGSFTFAVFFLCISFLLAKWGIVATFSFAALAALIMHGGVLFLLKRSQPSPKRPPEKHP
jgi:hypothetical protein